MKLGFTVIIPARFNSSRLPGKALADIAGKPMVQHVYERACQSDAKRVIVATDDARIAEICTTIGAPVCMTSVQHQNGTERLSEAVTLLDAAPDDIIVNVQGDQPLIPPHLINQVAQCLSLQKEANMATLCTRILSLDELHNDSVVKVVLDAKQGALYFSRSPIPWAKQYHIHLQTYYRHIGLYAYRAETIAAYVTWPQTTTEQSEALEQLRFLHYGARIQVALAEQMPPPEVNTPEDLELIRAQASFDKLRASGTC